MTANSVYYCLLFLASLKSFCFCFDPFSGVVTAFTVATSAASYYLLRCRTFECCDDDWIRFDESRLKQNLTDKLFGQHLAQSVIYKTLVGHLKYKNPKKPLVMAFNGLTGSGKNYAAQMIASSLYKNGMESSYVHLYVANKDFPHVQKVPEYQDRLSREIQEFTKQCGRSLFIFDEIDKMPPGTLDALKPFLDYHGTLNTVDYRKNIFIFLSNAGSSEIVSIALNFWAEGRDREEIAMKHIEPLINKGAFNEKGGFQFSELLRSELIDVFVPFLPLEKRHVKKCIEEEVRNQKLIPSSTLVNKIVDDLVYFPPEVEMFSKSGCKRIQQKIDIYFEEF